MVLVINTLRPRQNGRHFPDDTFKCIFPNENIYISITISLKFVPKVPINNIPTLVPIMAWRRPGDKSLLEPMMVRLPTHKCVSRPQRVKHHNRHWPTRPHKIYHGASRVQCYDGFEMDFLSCNDPGSFLNSTDLWITLVWPLWCQK